MKIVLVRQRPGIGDCLLLAPLIEQIKTTYPKSELTVITDDQYLGGALPIIFKGIPGVDYVENISSFEWTTESNRMVDPQLRGSSIYPLPYTVRKANLLFDCNGQFLEFEREYRGLTPYGIAEFWLRYHNFFTSGLNLLPKYNPSGIYAEMQEKPLVGIVLRAGHTARDWDYNGLSTQIANWLHTSGYIPVGIDAIKTLPSPYGFSCVGKNIDYVARLIKQCKLIITPDTGLLHLAQAVGTPQVALWGIISPELRTEGYNCTLVPKESLGYCKTDEENKQCQCNWKFQKWSCLRRITLNMIIEGIENAITTNCCTN